MKMKALVAAAATMLVAGSAQATQVAGWSFDSYYTAGLLQDNAGTNNFLAAQFSDFDPTFGAGAESATFGTAHFDGTNGSTNVSVAGFPADFGPSAGNLSSNTNAPLNGTPVTEVDFNGGTGVLAAEGVGIGSSFSMITQTALSVVFAADVSSLSDVGSNWSVSFAGISALAGDVNVTVEFSTNGSSYTAFGGTQILNNVDSAFSVALGTDESNTAFVRLNLDAGAIIDNLSIDADMGPASVPEPGAALMALWGLAGLGLMGRRDR